jgi:putative heme-binding domain-containing protein
MAAAIRTLVAWQENLEPQSAGRKVLEQTISTIHSVSGIPLQWQIVGPVTVETAATILESIIAKQPAGITLPSFTNSKRMMVDRSSDGVHLPAAEDKPIESVWLAAADLLTDEPDDIEFLASSHGSLTVWLNGREVFKRSELTKFHPNSERFEGRLAQGENRLLVRVGANHGDARFQLHFRRKSSRTEHERLTHKALADTGDSERGRKLFMDADKSQCIHCHRIGTQGARIGPDLAGIGSRFSRIHLIESILEPSRTVAPSYETVVVALNSGRILAGVKVSETGEVLVLGDTKGKIHKVYKSEIEEIQAQSQSTMPDGLEKRLTELEFVDLISFLVSEKKIPQ